MAFMYRAWPNTKGILCSAHRSAIQYQVKTCPPPEDAFHSYDDIFTKWLYGPQKEIPVGFHVLVEPDLTGAVKDADIHFFGVKVDSAIKFVLFGVKSHWASSFLWIMVRG